MQHERFKEAIDIMKSTLVVRIILVVFGIAAVCSASAIAQSGSCKSMTELNLPDVTIRAATAIQLRSPVTGASM